MKGYFSEEALEIYGYLTAQSQSQNFAEGESYDFTRCVRPDGSTYGTRGKCRKGAETGAKDAPESKPELNKAGKIKELGDKIEDLHSRSKRELSNGFRDRALQLHGEAIKLTQEKADLQREATRSKIEGARDKWKAAETLLKKAEENHKKVMAETKGKKGPEAQNRRYAAEAALEKAQMIRLKASDRFHKANKTSTASVPPKNRMTKKDPVESVLKSQEELKKFNKKENARVADTIRAGKVKGVSEADLKRVAEKKKAG